MAETPAQTLRRAAEKLRAVANDALRDIPMNEYWEARHHPDCTEDELYRAGVENGLGGPAGVLAGACTPGVMLLVADWLDAEAGAHEGGMGASETLRDMFAEAGAGEFEIQVAVSTLNQASAVARAILGDGAVT